MKIKTLATALISLIFVGCGSTMERQLKTPTYETTKKDMIRVELKDTT